MFQNQTYYLSLSTYQFKKTKLNPNLKKRLLFEENNLWKSKNKFIENLIGLNHKFSSMKL